MADIAVIGWIFPALAMGILYAPTLAVKPKDRLSGKDLARARPSRRWMRWVVPVVTVGFALALLWLGLILLTSIDVSDVFSENADVAGGILACCIGALAVLNGLFAVWTGVCPLPTRMRYFWVVRKDLAQRIGAIQVTAGLMVVIGAGLVIFFWR